MKNSDNMIEIRENINLSESGLNYTMKAGKYFVNEDGKIYLNNVPSK